MDGTCPRLRWTCLRALRPGRRLSYSKFIRVLELKTPQRLSKLRAFRRTDLRAKRRCGALDPGSAGRSTRLSALLTSAAASPERPREALRERTRRGKATVFADPSFERTTN